MLAPRITYMWYRQIFSLFCMHCNITARNRQFKLGNSYISKHKIIIYDLTFSFIILHRFWHDMWMTCQRVDQKRGKLSETKGGCLRSNIGANITRNQSINQHQCSGFLLVTCSVCPSFCCIAHSRYIRHYWRCPHSMHRGVYVTVGHPSVRPSVRPSVCPIDREQQRRPAGLQLSALEVGDINR